MVKLRVFYWKKPLHTLLGEKPSLNTLHSTHVEVYSADIKGPVTTDFLEQLYRTFNDYESNPLSAQNDPKKQQFLQDNGIHTSMSEGDVAMVGDETWYCNYSGWKRFT